MIATSPRQKCSIVVAVDGSPESASALRWAAAHAADVGKGVRVVTAYECAGERWTVAPSRVRASSAVSQMIASTPRVGHVDHVVAAGAVDELIVAHAQDASMVVVGSTSPIGPRGVQDCVVTQRIERAVNCPVIQVPPDAAAIELLA